MPCSLPEVVAGGAAKSCVLYQRRYRLAASGQFRRLSAGVYKSPSKGRLSSSTTSQSLLPPFSPFSSSFAPAAGRLLAWCLDCLFSLPVSFLFGALRCFLPTLFSSFFFSLAYAMASTVHFPDTASFQQQANGFINWLGSKPGVRMNSKIRMPDLGTLNAQQGAGTSLIRR